MKKKILVIFLVGMFLQVGILSMSSARTISIESKENINQANLVYTQMLINSNPPKPIINHPFYDGAWFVKGDYQTTLDIGFHCPPFHRIVGEVWADVWIVSAQFYSYHKYIDFTYDNIPDDIHQVYIEYLEGIGVVILRAGYDYKVYERYSPEDPWVEVGHYYDEKEVIANNIVFPKGKSYIRD